MPELTAGFMGSARKDIIIASLPYTLKALLLCVKHNGGTNMATNLAIDDWLIDEAKAI